MSDIPTTTVAASSINWPILGYVGGSFTLLLGACATCIGILKLCNVSVDEIWRLVGGIKGKRRALPTTPAAEAPQAIPAEKQSRSALSSFFKINP